jgi:hypothetical protein
MVHRNANPAAGDDGARQEIQSGRIGTAVNSQMKAKVKDTAGIAVAVDEDNDCLYLEIELNNDCAVILTFPKKTGETPRATIWHETLEEPFQEGWRAEEFRLWAELAAGVIDRETYFDRVGACADCGVGTHSINEYYMVKNHVWVQAQGGTKLLCIGCLEKRIGRTLTRSDFDDAASVNADANTFRRKFSDRLQARLISDKSRAVP